MLSAVTIAAFIAIFVAALLVADAVVGMVRAARGIDENAVDRRLTLTQPASASQRVEILRARRAGTFLPQMLVPFYQRYAQFVRQSHLDVSPERMMGIMGLSALVALAVLLVVLPARVAWTSLLFAPIFGAGIPLYYVGRARSKFRTQFEEQLPDAIDLIVRSLRIGHPVSNAISLIAREMPAPIGPEFGIVAEQISYGHELPLAITEMQERVPAADLAYFSMAIQIQLESGGNLVE